MSHVTNSRTFWWIHSLPYSFTRNQCDQMTKLCFQYLAIFSNENVPNSIQIVPKWVENFAQNQINLKYIAKVFLNICQSGGISPNLVTLVGHHLVHFWPNQLSGWIKKSLNFLEPIFSNESFAQWDNFRSDQPDLMIGRKYFIQDILESGLTLNFYLFIITKCMVRFN